MKREVRLASYLPPFLQQYEEQNCALAAEDPEFELIWEAADRALRNEFIATADGYGLSRLEKILKILPSKEDTLESRRMRVQSRWFVAIPYTLGALANKLAALCGDGNFSITTQYPIYRIIIETRLELFGEVAELENIIAQMIPCNMITAMSNQILCNAKGDGCVAGGVSFTEMISAE